MSSGTSCRKGYFVGMSGTAIPAVLRLRILKELHATHIRIVKINVLAHSKCGGQNQTKMKHIAKDCVVCNATKDNSLTVSLILWE